MEKKLKSWRGMACCRAEHGSRFCTRACSLFTDGAQGGNGKCFQ